MSENKSTVIPVVVAIVVGIGAAYIGSMYFHSETREDIRKDIVAIKEQIQKMKESTKPTKENPRISKEELTELENKLMERMSKKRETLTQQQISELTESLRGELRGEIKKLVDEHDRSSGEEWEKYSARLDKHEQLEQHSR